jgi:uncharacterized membrane protein YfcA
MVLFAVLGVLIVRTLDDPTLRVATLAVVAMFAVRTVLAQRRRDREAREADKSSPM